MLENNKHHTSLLIVDFPTLIPPQNSMESLRNPAKPFNPTSKAICCQQGCWTRPHPKTSRNTIRSNYKVHLPLFLPLKGSLISPSPPGWHQSPETQCLAGRHISNIFGFHFLLHSGGAQGHARASAQCEREKNTEVDRESLLQPIMSVICPQIEERRDKERPSDTTHSVGTIFMRMFVVVCLYSCVCVCN